MSAWSGARSHPMSKKVFIGEKPNLPQLVKDVEQWLRQEGFEVQSGGGDGHFLIQAASDQPGGACWGITRPSM